MPYYQEKKKTDLRIVRDRIRSKIYNPLTDLQVTAWKTKEPVPYSQRRSGKKTPMKIGKKWGDLFDCAWFHFTGVVPKTGAGKTIVLLIDVNGEGCVYDAKGNPIQGLTTVNSHYDFKLGLPGKRVVEFRRRARGGEKVDLWVDAGCNDLFGMLAENGTLRQACIAEMNPELRALYYDVEVLYELMMELPEDSARRNEILFRLEEMAHLVRNYTEIEARTAREILAPALEKKNGDVSLRISAVGHAHMDLGWLWPIRETIRKGARTFSTVLDLMDKYPDFVFGASQPQLYQWMKDRYPSLYKKIKKRVAERRWEPQGAMWAEADTNVPSGESLVRQILYGKRFFRDEFGWETTTLWLPDVFGYSGALPQLMKKSGIDFFMTQKLSWNQFNQHPHDTFLWEGIDGSRIVTHMPPEDTYNSSAAPRAICKAERRFLDKGVSDRCLLVFGIGDGGGGPGTEHLERLQREKDLDGIAPVMQEPAVDFFEQIAKDSGKYQVWSGELYLERHQGTYTTQARNKRFNRKIEFALRELELWAAAQIHVTKNKYPQKAIEEAWKEILLYQFHDILPGSSITRVYDECLERYSSILDDVEQRTEKAISTLAGAIDTSNMEEPVLVTNSLSWERTEWVKLGKSWRKVTAPPMGYMAFDDSVAAEKPSQCSVGERFLENDILRIEFSKDGTIRSIFDKEIQREVLVKGGEGNCLAVYDDQGDAWDIPIHYDHKQPDVFALESSKYRVEGPRAVLKQIRKYGDSKLTQKIVLTDGSRRIDFVTEVDWRESMKMLRSSFPVAVHVNEVTCDIQFGQLKRPTHTNTSWEMAKYEICAQKWIDVSERNYGVGLLNDCKYGHKVRGNVLDIDLLRSPCHPDPSADRCRHQFVYSLYPHPGDAYSGGVVQAAYELNVPLQVYEVPTSRGVLPQEWSFVQVDVENVIIETVKKAEDNDQTILRLYETYGATTEAEIRFGTDVKAVHLVDLMEENPKRIRVRNRRASIALTPYEIVTLAVDR